MYNAQVSTKKPPQPPVEAKAEPDTEHDVVLVHGKTPDGKGLRVLRSRPQRLELAELRPVREGTPLNGRELLQLKRRAERVPLFDVEVLHDGRPAEAGSSEGPPAGSGHALGHAGPPRAATSSYRANWDRIFGAGPPGEDLPN